MLKKNISIPFKMDLNYYEVGNKSAERAYIIIHGYQHNARKALLDFEQCLPVNAHIIAPDAPFPVPRKQNSFANLGLAWCFESLNTKKGYISSLWAKDFLFEFLSTLDIKGKALTIVGFSQGGIVGFPLANDLLNIDSLIGVSTYPNHNFLDTNRTLKVIGIHGNNDDVFNCSQAEAQYEQLKNLGHQVDFICISDLGHYVDGRVQNILKEKIDSFITK